MNRSFWIALFVAVAAAGWMASGMLGEPTATESDSEVQQPAGNGEPQGALMRVQTTLIEQQPITQSISLQGVASPLRELVIKAETGGRVDAVTVPRGTRVEANAVLAQLELSERRARLKEAEALLTQRTLEYEASRKLKTQGMRSDSQLAESVTLLESARRQLQAIKLDIEKATVTAPFAGIIEIRHVEIGDYLQAGDPVALLVQLDPFVVKAQVSENQIANVKQGMSASTTLVNGQNFNATVSYISAQADPATRTFTVEFEIRNPKATALFGSTAQVEVPLEQVDAHRISPSVLSLDRNGRIAVKTVENGRVRTWPVSILKSGADGFWVSGLPASAEVISVGADFTQSGDQVEVLQRK